MNIRKHTLIERLRHFAKVEGRGIRDEYGHDDYRPSRGETTLATMVADYLERPWIEDCWPEENWLLNLPNLLVSAFEAFRREPEFQWGRVLYASECDGREIPNIVDAQAGGINRVLVANGVARMMSVLSGEGAWLRDACHARFEGQMQEIDKAWRRFVRVAYSKMIARINAESHRGNTGTFGATKLMTFACAGRVILTFASDSGTMTFVADVGDPTGERSGPNTPSAPWQVCVDMINEVADNWDLDKLQRSDTVGIW